MGRHITRIRNLASYELLYGDALPSEQLLELFRRVPAEPALSIIGSLSLAVSVKGPDHADVVEHLVDKIQDVQLRELALLGIRSGEVEALFSPQALAVAAQLCCLPSGEDHEVGEWETCLLKGILAITDLIGIYEEEPEAVDLDALAWSVFVSQAASTRHALRDLFLRYHSIYLECWPRVRDLHPKEYWDLPAAFRRSVGVDLDRFLALAFTLASKLDGHGRSSSGLIPAELWNPDLSAATVDPAEMSALHRCISTDITRLAESAVAAVDEDRWSHDDRHLMERPVVKVGDRRIAASFPHLTRTLTDGVVWIAGDKRETSAARTCLGRAFEEYVRDLLRVGGEDLFFSGVPEGLRDVEIDGLLLEPPQVLVVEALVATPMHQMKSPEKQHKFHEYIARILVEKSKKLQSKIEAMQGSPTAAVNGLPLSEIDTYWPVLVFLADVPVEPHVLWPYYCGKLEEAGVDVTGSMRRLQLCSVVDLEYLMALRSTQSPIGILREKLARRGLQGESVKNFVLDKFGDSADEHFGRHYEEAWKRLEATYIQEFFHRDETEKDMGGP